MKPMELTADNFAAETAKGLTVVDFWASWCGPCRLLSPIVDELAEELTDVRFGKVNVDEQPELANTFGVSAIPTLVFIRDGAAVNRSVGLVEKEDLSAMIGAAKA